MPLNERKRIAADMWENLGRTFAEGFYLKEIMDEGRIRFEPKEQFDEIARGGPCIVCGLHLGNWELVAYAGKLMGAPFTGVYQRLSNPYVDAATLKLREASTRAGFCQRRRSPRARCSRPPRKAAIPRSSPTCATTAARPFLSSALSRARPSFPALLARTTGLPLYAGAAFRRPTCAS